MKITAIKTEQGLEKGKEYDLCDMATKKMISLGIAEETVQEKKNDNDSKHITNSRTAKPKRSKAASKGR
jgi:hypothetical protein